MLFAAASVIGMISITSVSKTSGTAHGNLQFPGSLCLLLQAVTMSPLRTRTRCVARQSEQLLFRLLILPSQQKHPPNTSEPCNNDQPYRPPFVCVAFNGTNEPGRRVSGRNPATIVIGYACRSKSLTARYWFTAWFQLVGSVESATVGGTRCRLTLCRLAIGAHLPIREERLSRLPTCGACRFVLNPSPSPRPSASWKARPIGLGTIPGVFRASGNSAPLLGPSVVGRFGVCVVVEAVVSKMRLRVNKQSHF